MTDAFVGVYVLDAPCAIDRIYDYSVPRSLCDEVHRGSFVTVPFGSGNRKHLALVVELRDASPYARIKPIVAVSADRISLSEEMLGLALFMKEQTLCTVGDAVRAIIPAFALTRMVECYLPAAQAATASEDALSPQDKELLSYLRENGCATTREIHGAFGSAADEALCRLRERRLIVRDAQYEDVDATSYTVCRRLNVDKDKALLLASGEECDGVRLRSDKQRSVLRLLAEQGEPIADRRLCEEIGCSSSVLLGLTQKGLLAEHKIANDRNPYAELAKQAPAAAPVTLNDEQKAAFDVLRDFSDSNEPHAALLHGVTGSGKTSVMLALIKHLLESGKGVIVLLPEIALTPQSIAIFCAHFGDRVAVIHSGLSAGERYDAYERIRKGVATVVVGTRSAVFSPVARLGAIIIDEEQEHTYKSDMNPKYRAHDIARYRCAKSGALMLLASATPSLESYHKAVEGKYTLLKLTRRYGDAVLPEVVIADMRRETGSASPLGSFLCERLVENFQADRQAILFLNRRGYHRFVSCRSCGTALRCEQCSVTMTYHTKKGDYTKGELVCHFCGSRRAVPTLCPECGSEHLARGGYGTQRVEQELSELLPSARILRMDADTTSTKFSYDQMLGDFRARKADVLLGTQMVTKGHDFPAVTLVGALSADASLYVDDYRASERTFAQLTQVIGRAGRGSTPGLAVIQTANPDSDVIRLACAQDYETFYQREIKLRRLLVFPPFCDIVLLSVSSKDEKLLLLSAKRLHDELYGLLKGEFSDVQAVVFGPFEAPVYRVDNRYRMRMVVKCRLNKRSRALFSALQVQFGKAARCDVQLSIDLNPSSL